MRTPLRFASLALLAALAAAPLVFRAQSRADAADDLTTLRGVATDKRGPAADAEVAAGIIGWAPAAGDHVVTAMTDGEGRFSLQRAPLGPIDVWIRPKGGEWTFVLRMSHPGVNDLAVDARPKEGVGGRGFGGFGGDRDGTVTGVVTDKQGKPVARAAAGLRGDDSTWVLTDAKGEFTLTKAGDDDGLVVRANGFRDAVTRVKLDKKRMTIKLDVAKPTVVHVDDPAGKPLAGAWVTLGDPEDIQTATGFSSLFPPRPRLVGAWTDAKGDARIAWGGPDDETVATAYALGSGPASKKVSASKGPIRLQVTPARPMFAVCTMKGGDTPVGDVYLGLPHESDGGPDAISALPASAERGPVVVGRTDESGRCLIPHVPPGVDTLRVVGEQKRDAEVRLEPLGVPGGGK